MSQSQVVAPTMKPILIFPAGMPRSLEYLDRCIREGRNVIGSSSLHFDPSKGRYPDWTYLPFITDEGFEGSFKRALDELDVCGIFCPNPGAWLVIDRILREMGAESLLLNPWPVDQEMAPYRGARSLARRLIEWPLLRGTGHDAAPMSEIELAALFRHANAIPGMCDDEKIAALHELGRLAVKGDIVEIGSWWGKSAFVLARLASVFDIGNLLCVDPWVSEHLVQDDGTTLLDTGSAMLDTAEAHDVFQMNLLPYSKGHVNYLRMLSVDAAVRYRQSRTVSNDTFGTTNYAGEISILHVDGNHRYEAAKEDILAWSGLVRAGGWIIVDDYIWPYGDGPKIAGDEFLADHWEHIEACFVMGSCLIIRLASPIEG